MIDLRVTLLHSCFNTPVRFLFLKVKAFVKLTCDPLVVLHQLLDVILMSVLQHIKLTLKGQILRSVVLCHALVVALELSRLSKLAFEFTQLHGVGGSPLGSRGHITRCGASH